jgi:hypothetical protein
MYARMQIGSLDDASSADTGMTVFLSFLLLLLLLLLC